MIQARECIVRFPSTATIVVIPTYRHETFKIQNFHLSQKLNSSRRKYMVLFLSHVVNLQSHSSEIIVFIAKWIE